MSAFGRKADSGQPLLTNLDLRVHGLEWRGRRTRGLAGAMNATAWKTSQGSSLGEFSAFPRLPAARRDGDGSIVVGGYEIDTGTMCQLCPGFLLGKNRTASLSVMNQRLLLAAILAILAAGHVRRTIRCIFHRNHDLWILERQRRP